MQCAEGRVKLVQCEASDTPARLRTLKWGGHYCSNFITIAVYRNVSEYFIFVSFVLKHDTWSTRTSIIVNFDKYYRRDVFFNFVRSIRACPMNRQRRALRVRAQFTSLDCNENETQIIQRTLFFIALSITFPRRVSSNVSTESKGKEKGKKKETNRQAKDFRNRKCFEGSKR